LEGEIIRPPTGVAGTAIARTVEGMNVDAARLTKRIGQASVILLEFADFQCPYCSRYATETFPKIKHELIDSGKISYAYVNFPLESIHRDALRASEAAECADRQGKFWEMFARLYANQSRLTQADLVNHAHAVALDQGTFSQCLSSDASAAVKADIEIGNAFGVQSTPDFFVGTIRDDGTVELTKHITGAAPFEAFKETVNEVVKGRTGWLSRWPFAAKANLPVRKAKGIE
jgi:protein-disulfide isomerase